MEVRSAIAGVNQRQQWCIDVQSSIVRLEQLLDQRARPVAVQVQASLNVGSMPAAAGTGLSAGGFTAQSRGGQGYVPPNARGLGTGPTARA